MTPSCSIFDATRIRLILRGSAGRCLPVIASPTLTWCDRPEHTVALRALRVELLPDPFTTQDLLAAACAAVEQARSARWRSDLVLGQLRTLVNGMPPF